MGKGIKKFDQSLFIYDGRMLFNNSAATAVTTDGNGSLYIYANDPWFANTAETYQLANASNVYTLSSQTWTQINTNSTNISTNATNISTNATNITNIINSGITFADNDGHSGIVGIGETLTITGGTNISVIYDSSLSSYTINTTAAATNYYLSSATISNAVITFDMAGGYADHTLDLKEQITLDQLSGVSAASPSDGDYLIYDSSTGLWRATGITEDSLIAGSGITFDTSVSGQVTINSILAGTGGTWIGSDEYGTTYHVLYTDTIMFSGGTNIDVTWDSGNKAYVITNTASAYNWSLNGTNVNSGDNVSISANSGLTNYGTAPNVIIGHTNSYSISNNTSGLYVNDYTIDAYGHISNVTPRDLTSNLDNRYVNVTGDTMTGALTINVGSGNQALTTQGDVTINGDLYVSGTTVTVDAENLTVTDNIIVINSGETGNGVSRGTSGIMVDRGTLSEYVFIFDENSDTFRIGETTSSVTDNIISTGDTQAVATRNEEAYMLANGLVYWNATEHRLDSIASGDTLSNNDIAIYDITTSAWTYQDINSVVNVYSWSTINADSGSISTNAANQTMTIAGGNLITTSTGSSTITIDHDTVSYSAPSTATNEFISSLTVDSYGHITAASNSSVDFTVTDNTSQFLSANTSYFATMSADTGSYNASSVADTFTIVGGIGIDTSISGNVLTITSDNTELQYTATLGGTSTTLTDPDFTGAKVVIIDYLVDGATKQEGQLRYLVNDDILTNDYQGDLNLSFSDASISGTDLVLTHDSNTDTFEYYVKIIK